ncbi:MAG: hypothetical protein HEQ13_21195 [Dolichospermum sp. DEX189]|nr:hypothetical protein [Dolichospermum sp. DEX189]
MFVRGIGTGNREQGTGKRQEARGKRQEANYLFSQYYCQFSKICLKPNKIVRISIGFQGFGNSIVSITNYQSPITH